MTPAGSAATGVPAWLHRAGAISWRFLAIAGLGAVLIWTAFLLGTVTASVLLALIVSATVAPLVRRLRARGWSKSGSAAAMTAAALGVGLGVVLLLLLALVPDMPGVVSAIQTGLDEIRDQLSSVSVPPDVAARIQDVASGVASWIAGWVGSIVGSIAGTVTVVILALFLTYYMLTDGDRAWAWVLQGTAGERRSRIEASGHDALERVGGYLRGTAVVSAARAIAFGVYLEVLGVPHALPLAVLVFVGGFIPYLGGLVAMVTVLIVALGSVGPSITLLLLGLMAGTNALIANLLRPRVYGSSVHLHPAIVLIVLPIGGAVAGIIGLIAAIPVAAIIAAIGGAIVAALEPDRVPGQDREVSGWVDRLAQWSWRLLAAMASAAVVLFVIGQAPLVVTPVVLAAIIAATVAPLARALRERGWGPSRAAMAVTGSAYLVILALVVLAITQLAAPLGDAIRSSVAGAEQLEDDAAGTLGWVGSLARVIGSDMLGVFAAVLEAVAAVGIVLVLAALLSFYLVRDAPTAWECGAEADEAVAARRDRRYRSAFGRPPGQLHAGHGGHLGGWRDRSAGDHAHPGTPIRGPHRHPLVYRVLHSLHRRIHHDGDGVPHRRRLRHADGDRDHVRLHDRHQHRAGQCRHAPRLRARRQPAPRCGPACNSRRWRRGRHRGDVPGRAAAGTGRGLMAHGPLRDGRPTDDTAARGSAAGRRRCIGAGARAEPWRKLTDPGLVAEQPRTLQYIRDGPAAFPWR